jgi:hypothetical protein
MAPRSMIQVMKPPVSRRLRHLDHGTGGRARVTPEAGHDGRMSVRAQVTQSIAADPELVYKLVSDVTRMGEWSPETASCRWLGGASGPVVGARFRGTNQRGPLRWSTTCTVTAAEPAREFTFSVAYGLFPVSMWSYTFEPTDDGCEVTESWVDRRPLWMRLASPAAMAIVDRGAHNRGTMEKTLAALKAAAES